MKKIAYIRTFSSHPIFQSVEAMLANSFPEYQVEPITITDFLKGRPVLIALNGLAVVGEYYKDILKSPSVLRRRFLRTPFLFRKVQQLIGEKITPNREQYRFSFQLHSLFDAHIVGLPHFIYTDHTFVEGQRYDYRHVASSPAWAKLERQIYSNAETVFTWSSNVAASVINDYGITPEKVVCAYTGANVLRHEPIVAKDYSSQEILFVGIDWERKGGPALIEAFRTALETYPNAHLTIIGSSPAVDLPNCRVLGNLPMGELKTHYLRATIFCLPTRREPFGSAFLEAMQYALPIIGTNVGAIPDFVKDGENGYLVEPDDANALARALICLLEDTERRREFGARSNTLFEQRYTWPSVGSAIRKAILKVIPPEDVLTASGSAANRSAHIGAVQRSDTRSYKKPS